MPHIAILFVTSSVLNQTCPNVILIKKKHIELTVTELPRLSPHTFNFNSVKWSASKTLSFFFRLVLNAATGFIATAHFVTQIVIFL